MYVLKTCQWFSILLFLCFLSDMLPYEPVNALHKLPASESTKMMKNVETIWRLDHSCTFCLSQVFSVLGSFFSWTQFYTLQPTMWKLHIHRSSTSCIFQSNFWSVMHSTEKLIHTLQLADARKCVKSQGICVHLCFRYTTYHVLVESANGVMWSIVAQETCPSLLSVVNSLRSATPFVQ